MTTDDKITVLMVDDEEDFLRPVCKRLSLRNLNVLAASSGTEALEILGKDPAVDVVVLDVKMPNMDGLTTIKRLKQTNSHAQVIMLTGHAELKSSVEGIKLGAFDYLLKPVQIDELVNKIIDA